MPDTVNVSPSQTGRSRFRNSRFSLGRTVKSNLDSPGLPGESFCLRRETMAGRPVLQKEEKCGMIAGNHRADILKG